MVFRRILLATDFSSNAHAAQGYACQLAETLKAELHLLTVLYDATLIEAAPGVSLMSPASNMDEVRASAEQALARTLPSEWAARHEVVYSMRVGRPWEEIVRYADENDIDLIVIGTQGRTGLAHILLGSVAERVVRHSRCPVLTVRHPEAELPE